MSPPEMQRLKSIKERVLALTGIAVYLDFKDAIERDGRDAIEARYGNLFEMYQRIK